LDANVIWILYLHIYCRST